MPEDRPERIHVFIDRDEEYFQELENLSKAVVMYTHDYPLLVQLDQVVKIAVDTGLVREAELRISELTRGRFLIHLPEGLKVETFIAATDPNLWDNGMTFQQWSPHDDVTAIVIPRFKILLDLVGHPILLWREKQIINAVSKFGTYLGTVKPEIAADKKAWKVAAATDDLSRVPKNVVLTAGGMEFTVPLKVVAWEKGAVYTARDIPPHPPRHPRPAPVIPPQETEEEVLMNMNNPGPTFQEEPLIISRRALREMCVGIPKEALTPVLLQALTGPKVIEDDGTIFNELMTALESRPSLVANRDGTSTSLGMHNTPELNKAMADNERGNPNPNPEEEMDNSNQFAGAGQSRKENDSSDGSAEEEPQGIPLVKPTHSTTSVPSQGAESKSDDGTQRPQGIQTVITGATLPIQITTGDQNLVQPTPEVVHETQLASQIGQDVKYFFLRQTVDPKGEFPHIPMQLTSDRQVTGRSRPIKNKRKKADRTRGEAGPSEKEAQASIGPDGNYIITVKRAHSEDLATACGLEVEEVERAVTEDNRERAQPITQTEQPDPLDTNMEDRGLATPRTIDPNQWEDSPMLDGPDAEGRYYAQFSPDSADDMEFGPEEAL